VHRPAPSRPGCPAAGPRAWRQTAGAVVATLAVVGICVAAAEPYVDWAERASCGLSEGTGGALTLTTASLDAQARQSVQVYPDDAAAVAALDRWAEGCTAAGAPVTPAGARPATAGRAEPADQEYVGSVSSAVAVDNVLVVVDITGNISPADLDVLAPDVADAATLLAERVDGALDDGRAVLG
jgi:hypothetical protein